jgi:acyl carrier protein
MIEIKQKVDEIIDYYLVPIDGKFTPESRLVEDLEADELDSIEILMELEKQFNINIPDSEWVEIKTVQDIYNIVEQKLQNK